MGARGILEAVKAIRGIEKTGETIREAVTETEDAIEMLNDLPDIDLGPAIDDDDIFSVEVADDAIDDIGGSLEQAVDAAVSNVTAYFVDSVSALARTSEETEGSDEDENKGLVIDHLFNIHAPCVLKGSAILMILLFVVLVYKCCCPSCGNVYGYFKEKNKKAAERRRERERRGEAMAAIEAGAGFEDRRYQNMAASYHTPAHFQPAGAVRQVGTPAYQPPPAYQGGGRSRAGASGRAGGNERDRPWTVEVATGSAGAAALIHGEKEPWER